MRLTELLPVCFLLGCASTTDGVQGDGQVSVVDIPTATDIHGTDAPGIDVGAMDGGDTDLGATDGGGMGLTVDVSLPDAGNACATPPTLPSRWSFVESGYMGPITFAFDGQGNVAEATDNGSLAMLGADGTPRMLANGTVGLVQAMAFAPTGELVMSSVTEIDGGVLWEGNIVAINVTTGALRTVVPNIGGPYGVLVDALDYVWYSDGFNGTVSRVLLSSLSAVPTVVVRGLPGPTGLMLDATGSNLYVTCSHDITGGAVYEVPLVYGDGGARVTALPATRLAGGLVPPDELLTDMALDACGNLYVLNLGGPILFIPPGSHTATATTEVNQTLPSGLAFGQGGSFDSRSLYTLDNIGELYAAPIGIQGIPLPRP